MALFNLRRKHVGPNPLMRSAYLHGPSHAFSVHVGAHEAIFLSTLSCFAPAQDTTSVSRKKKQRTYLSRPMGARLMRMVPCECPEYPACHCTYAMDASPRNLSDAAR